MAPTLPPALSPRMGYWGVPTATLDWCETNYDVTIFIAEFWNTLSNLAMILPSFLAFYRSYRNGIEKRFMLSLLFLGIVGFGSWAFHMTLLYEMQLFDELPMLWGSLTIVYCMITLLVPSVDRSVFASRIIKASLVFYGVISMVIYIGLKTPILFQIAYGILVTLMFYLNVCVAKYRPCEVRLFYASALLYYTGFALWNIDNIFCDNLEQIRQLMPHMIRPFLQFHALWHCFAGYGSYLQIIYCAHSRALSLNRKVYLITDWTGVRLEYGDAKKIV